jgi:PAS domain S-box-containing protein
MQDQDNKKTKEQLLKEIAELRTQIAELEQWKTERIRLWARVEESSRYAENILETARDSFLVLDADLKVISANRYFYDTFKVKPEETIGQFIFDLGNQQWDISRLRILLENVLPKSTKFDNYEVEHNFQAIGHKTMLLNARQIYRKDVGTKMILLAIEDITERKEMDETIRRQATHDSLTGLPNRMLFMDHFTLALNQAHRYRAILAVMFLDLDQFKSINDTKGHNIGDKLLKSIADRLRACVRNTDTVARMGGDEYLILLTIRLSRKSKSRL